MKCSPPAKLHLDYKIWPSHTTYKKVKTRVRLGPILICFNFLTVEYPYGDTNLFKFEADSI